MTNDSPLPRSDCPTQRPRICTSSPRTRSCGKFFFLFPPSLRPNNENLLLRNSTSPPPQHVRSYIIYIHTYVTRSRCIALIFSLLCYCFFSFFNFKSVFIRFYCFCFLSNRSRVVLRQFVNCRRRSVSVIVVPFARVAITAEQQYPGSQVGKCFPRRVLRVPPTTEITIGYAVGFAHDTSSRYSCRRL